MNTVELTGRLTKNVELKTTSSGVSVTTLTLAVKPDFVKKGEEPTPEFIPVTVWGSLADVCNENIYKGYLVGVTGRLHRRSYNVSDDDRRYETEVIADKVEFMAKPMNSEEPAEAKKSKSKRAS